ncbi:unnamed protein product, partial [Brassica rapa subsp. narinosa]
CPLPEALETVESLEKGIKEEELSKGKIQYRKMYQALFVCTSGRCIQMVHLHVLSRWQGRSQIPDSPAKPPTHRGSVSNNTPNSTLLQTDAAWREDLHLAGLGWIVGEGTEKVSILAHCHYVNSSLVAEGLALRKALQFCIEKNIRQIRCETDSLLLVKALNSGQQATEIYGIMADIVCLS